MHRKKKGQIRKKLLVFECCVCEENTGREMNGYFCGLVTFLTSLSVSTLLKLKLYSCEHTINNVKSGTGSLERFELCRLW